jgi:hypothetical protein
MVDMRSSGVLCNVSTKSCRLEAMVEKDRFPDLLITSFTTFGAVFRASLSFLNISSTGVPCWSSGPCSPFALLVAAASSLTDGSGSVFGPVF